MANTAAYFGFSPVGLSAGAAPTFSLTQRRIASGNGTAIYRGDPVMPVIGSTTGYITQGAAGTTRLDGIFWGCQYYSTAGKKTVYSPYWPGSDATGDVLAYVIDAPSARFKVQANGSSMVITGTSSAWTYSPVGQYAQFAIGTGSTATGLSGAYIASVATTVTHPFIVLDMVQDPPGQNGTDPTTNYNFLIVGFNNEILRANGAGPTGIS